MTHWAPTHTDVITHDNGSLSPRSGSDQGYISFWSESSWALSRNGKAHECSDCFFCKLVRSFLLWSLFRFGREGHVPDGSLSAIKRDVWKVVQWNGCASVVLAILLLCAGLVSLAKQAASSFGRRPTHARRNATWRGERCSKRLKGCQNKAAQTLAPLASSENFYSSSI